LSLHPTARAWRPSLPVSLPFNNNYPMIEFLGGEIVSDTSNIGKMNLAKNTF
jgi:hypothetical protein